VAEFDLIVKDGTIVDGTGLPRYRSDIGVKDGRISEIGTISATNGTQTIDASGLIVAPGFVDTHTHYDAQIQWDPWCTASGWHGVTSVVIGNCGFGFAPVAPESRDRAMLMMSRNEQIPYETLKAGMLWDWVTYPEWLDTLDRIPKGVNCVSLVPVSPLMVWAMGLDEAKSGRAATDTETKNMQALLDEAMAAGGVGFSLQRLGERSGQGDYDGTPMPSDVMGDDLILAFADVLKARSDGVIQLAEGEIPDLATLDPNIDVLEFLFSVQTRFLDFEEELARRSGRPLIHNIVVPVDGFPDGHRSRIKWLEDCNARGLRIFGQGNTIKNTVIFKLKHFTFFDTSPAWAEALIGDPVDVIRKLQNPELRGRMRAEERLLVMDALGGSLAKVKVYSVPSTNPELDRYVGRTLGHIAADEGKHEMDVFLDLSVAGDLEVEFKGGSFGGDDPEMLAEVARSRHVIPGISDGGAHTKFLVGASYTTQMLAWLVRDHELLTLEDAHWHLSYLPAHAFGFKNRGFLREGAAADMVVYDLENLRLTPADEDYEIAYDFPAGEWRRIQKAEGYRWTIVNGNVTFEDGKCTEETPGRLLRNGKDSR
jgi:N-acyl-D-aspartate/D-glutamate deacylase